MVDVAGDRGSVGRVGKAAPRSTTLRDQIVAALKGAYPVAMTTVELAQQLPPVVATVRDDCRAFLCGEPPPDERYRIPGVGCELLECHGTWHVVRRRCRASDIHRHLVALARSGRVIRLGHHRSAPSEPWTVEPDVSDLTEIDCLERTWASS